MNGEYLDLSSDPAGTEGEPQRRPGTSHRFLGVHFTCCDIYSRVYVNRDETAYAGRCPGCGRRITFAIGPGGTTARFFRAE